MNTQEMKFKINAAIIFILTCTTWLWAYNGTEIPGDGPYSSAMKKLTLNAPDPAIPGFIGPDGPGACLEGAPNNYVNPIFIAWASIVVDYSPSDATGLYAYDSIGNGFEIPENALGCVTGDNFDIVSLGDLDDAEIAAGDPAGSVTLGFDIPIGNGDGADFAVFENGFISAGGAGIAGEIFGELGYVEVSTDGEVFARFPSVCIIEDLVGNYGTVDSTYIYNLVGKHVNAYGQSWGTPFDLSDLLDCNEVTQGLVDLNEINYVRVVDIAGNGTFSDSAGNPIFDAWVTWGSGGLDLEAIGIINTTPEQLPGDCNGDGHVTILDFLILKSNYGSPGTFSDGDFDENGTVNILDFLILKNNYGI